MTNWNFEDFIDWSLAIAMENIADAMAKVKLAIHAIVMACIGLFLAIVSGLVVIIGAMHDALVSLHHLRSPSVAMSKLNAPVKVEAHSSNGVK